MTFLRITNLFIIKIGLTKLRIGVNMELCHISLEHIILSNNWFTLFLMYLLENDRTLHVALASLKEIILYLILFNYISSAYAHKLNPLLL